MGGVGFGIDIEPAGDAPDPKGLYEAMYDLVEANVRKFAKGKPYKQVTDDFLSIAREDGGGAKNEINFGFMDAAGLCQMSADACYHWFELLVAALREKGALDPLAASHGLRLRWKRPKPLKALLARCDEPLVELRGNLVSTGKLGREIYITSDDLGDDTIAMDDLEKSERAKVVAAFTKKKCACKVCAALRSKPALVLPKPKKAPKPPKSKAKLQKIGTSLYVDDPECTVLTAADLKGKIEGLRVHAPVTDLPDELAKLPLDWIGLTGTKITHVPDVLSRVPSLRYFSIQENPLRSLRELAKLPQLERIVIGGWPGVPLDELPFDALPKLEQLFVERCNLRTLPAKLGRLKRLDLQYNALESIPDAILALRSLEELRLGENPLKALPRSWAKLPHLRKLDVYKAPITEIGEGLDAIEELEVAETKVERLEVGRMASLRVLRAPETPLREIDALPSKLEWLDLSNTRITAFPDVRAAKDTLKLLQLNGNEPLRELPPWLGEITALENLQLKRLSVTQLPESMQNLRNLRSLAIGRMKVFPVPDWFGKLKGLEVLYVDKDDLPRGEAARLKKLLPKTKIRM